MPSFALTKVISEFPAPRGMPQLTQRLRLYLTYPFACDIEVTTYLFECMFLPIEQTKAHFLYLPFAVGQESEGIPNLFTQHLARGRIHRGERVFIFDKVTQ